ncbi:serine hydrolase domain-containing protein [Amycolatopsis jiangsuensis]|uniref:CubicO group peptidase (Beta-lactamase class C family) n=1 Tax=Amycolatopsis jiangsuensis TaxID=1181879 RepID=A0A840J1U4_9PSEU|nr:serine hydrolase domain-containing protein [Amycolatopsis jiangsuensis]MBB4688030.1 CubicO group peptidase (beta-lactamase class C family) [Amycolatopsis jiangsuensis]
MLDSTELALYRRLAREQAVGRAPSLVAAVVRDGEIAWSGARGRVGADRPTDDTQYRLGSITKTMIATAVLRLRDEGKLELTDPLERHLSGTAFGSATIAQLLSHTSGLTSESPGQWWERSPGADWAALASSLEKDATKLRPGFKFHYSNVGFGVLGELVARHRGRSWYDVVREEILTPLGMHRTTPHPEGAHAEGFAVHPFADVLLPEPSPDAGAMAPAGQLWSTITDLGRWTSFLGGHTGGVLSGGTLAEMRTMNTVDDTEVWTTGFGLGLMVARHQGRHLAGHTGSMPGFLAATLIDAATGTGALCLANSTSGVGITTLCLDLIGITEEREPALPAEWQPSTVDPKLLALTGLWHWGPTPYLLRVQSDGLLSLDPATGGGRASRFHPTGPDQWLGLDGYYAGETLTVGRGPDGTADHLNLATFIFSRTPYDPAAPIPGGVDEAGWR